MSQVVVDGIITNYYVTPKRENLDWLLILPGWKRGSAEWQSLADRLSEKVNVLVMDFPGFGVTPQPEKSFDTYDYANFVKLFLEKLGVRTCTVLGHSFGGRVGIIMSNQINTVVKKLILIAPGGIDNLTLKAKTIRALTPLTKLVKMVSGGQKSPIIKLLGSDDYNTAGSMKDIFVKVVNQRLRKQLKDIKMPLLVVWGDKDKTVSVENTKVIKRFSPNALIRIVWGSGHSPHIEKTDRLLEIIGEFL